MAFRLIWDESVQCLRCSAKHSYHGFCIRRSFRKTWDDMLPRVRYLSPRIWSKYFWWREDSMSFRAKFWGSKFVDKVNVVVVSGKESPHGFSCWNSLLSFESSIPTVVSHNHIQNFIRISKSVSRGIDEFHRRLSNFLRGAEIKIDYVEYTGLCTEHLKGASPQLTPQNLNNNFLCTVSENTLKINILING